MNRQLGGSLQRLTPVVTAHDLVANGFNSMMLTKQHKIYLGILGVAALGLVIDRTLLGPSEAVAESAEDLVVTPSADEGFEHTSGTLPSSSDSLAQKLLSIKAASHIDPLNVNNAFTPAWIASVTTATAQIDNQAILAEEFAATHRLTAVMGTGPGGYAIIDGKCLRVGQELDGMRLTSVGDRTAVFESGPLKVELQVQLDVK